MEQGKGETDLSAKWRGKPHWAWLTRCVELPGTPPEDAVQAVVEAAWDAEFHDVEQ